MEPCGYGMQQPEENFSPAAIISPTESSAVQCLTLTGKRLPQQAARPSCCSIWNRVKQPKSSADTVTQSPVLLLSQGEDGWYQQARIALSACGIRKAVSNFLYSRATAIMYSASPAVRTASASRQLDRTRPCEYGRH